ncbi:efflux RND transporter periplasmic adaptor subunit [Massilia sp. CT11-137]|uniref:efflux RND transporter periplasmic adaptor subunit n=1 Tax=Massilia sp. CT11-137 TaxID=3393901 RepID=UPI0039AFED1A
MTRTKRFTLITVAALAAVVLIVRAPAPAAVPNAPGKAKSLAVEAVRPAQVSWPFAVSASGPLAAWQEATISAETGGLRISALHVDVGTRVKRGQLLAELASETVRTDVRKAEAAVASARARLSEAQSDVRRGNAVRASGALSGQQIEQYEITELTAAATLKSAEADLESARIRLGQTRIVAVDDGVIASRSATLGAVVASGAELFTLVRDERIEWRAELDAVQLAQLRIGNEAEIGLPGGVTVKGRVRQLAPTLDQKTRVAIAYVELPKGAGARAGAYASGSIALGQRPATVLPSSAITLRDGRSYVFEIDAGRQTVIQHEVRTGRSRADQVEILDGIKPGTPVVRSGGAFLNDGDAVRLGAAKESA